MIGIEKMMTDASNRTGLDTACTQNQSKRKVSHLTNVKQE